MHLYTIYKIFFLIDYVKNLYLYFERQLYFKNMRKELKQIYPSSIVSPLFEPIIRISTCYLSKYQAICWIVLNSLSLSVYADNIIMYMTI